jgi:cathepsin C
MGMDEARLRIASNNTIQTIFSTQDIVECSNYSQGCEGGFPYLVSGKYGEDYGVAEESCNPYTGKDGKCSTLASCKRQYLTRYRYIGGFYGACNEALMRISLVKNGPIAVSFEVYDDFVHYQGGVYHHTFLKDDKNFKFEPFELTNHVVVIVGYSATDDGEKFWIVKNSWSNSWGEDGFFRIRRGTDECAIESIAVETDIVLQ